jgi:hypothetical protein
VRRVAELRLEGDSLRRPLDPRTGPTCEVLLSEQDPATVVFRASHAVMDARGVLAWSRDVFRALRGEPLAGAASELTDRALIRELAPSRRRRTPAPTRHSPLPGTASTPGYRWQRRTLPGRHPGLMGRILAAFPADPSGESLRFMVPVDQRRHLRTGHPASTANLTLPVFIDLAPGDRWQRVYEQLYAALDQQRDLALSGVELLAGRVPTVGLRAVLPPPTPWPGALTASPAQPCSRSSGALTPRSSARIRSRRAPCTVHQFTRRLSPSRSR